MKASTVQQADKLKVSVGIPAFNEGKNIRTLLSQILAQRQETFSLFEIIVLSDGSTDNTSSEVIGVPNPLVRLVQDGKRRGKVARQNELFKLFAGDVLVLLDGDIVLPGDDVLENLLAPFYQSPGVGLVCGTHWPLAPKTFIERLGYFGADYWEGAKNILGTKADMYNCLGQIRAFSKELTNVLIIPKEAGSFEDTFSFLFAKTHGFPVIIAHTARVKFRLSANLSDYLHQMTRYMAVSKSAGDFFKAAEVKRYDHVTPTIRKEAFLRTMQRYPLYISLCYAMLQIITYIYGKVFKPKAMWQVSASTKTV